MNVILFIAQVGAGILSLVVLANTYDDFRRGRESRQVFFIWSAAALSILLVTLFPGIIDWAISRLGGQRTGVGTIFGLGMVFLFYLSYRIFTKADRVEKDLTRLVQTLALRDLNKSRR